MGSRFSSGGSSRNSCSTELLAVSWSSMSHRSGYSIWRRCQVLAVLPIKLGRIVSCIRCLISRWCSRDDSGRMLGMTSWCRLWQMVSIIGETGRCRGWLRRTWSRGSGEKGSACVQGAASDSGCGSSSRVYVYWGGSIGGAAAGSSCAGGGSDRGRMRNSGSIRRTVALQVWVGRRRIMVVVVMEMVMGVLVGGRMVMVVMMVVTMMGREGRRCSCWR